MLLKINKMLVGIAVFCMAFLAVARDISSLTIDVENSQASINFESGVAGDGHVLYYACSDDGCDKGSEISAWPKVVRLGRVEDQATQFTFAIPSSMKPGARYAARAFLATSNRNYDNIVEGVSSAGNAFVDTGVKPQGGKTAVTIDFKFASATEQYYIFGTWNSKVFSFCAYINGSGNWAYACKKSDSPWTGTSLKASNKRTTLTLDSITPLYSVSNDGGSVEVTPSGVGTSTTSYPIYLFGRNNAGTFDKKSKATIYACVITHNGECVRDYLPAVKDGVAGLYDLKNNIFTASGNANSLSVVGETNLTYSVDTGDTAVSFSPVWPTTATTPPEYLAGVPCNDASDRVFASGGSKNGSAPLVLSGANDWGGSFSVNEGALIADFGQGLATTDNLVFNGGTYGLLTGAVFNWTIGSGAGETSIGTDVSEYGFTAYNHPFSVVAHGDASIPLEFGTASAAGFNPTRFILNDDWAMETVTFKNGITGNNSDASKPVLRIYTGAADAVVEGALSNVTLVKEGDGILSLRALNNSFGSIHPYGGTLVIAPPEGENQCTILHDHIYNNTANAGSVVITNATITQTNARGGDGKYLNQTWYGGTCVSLVGCRWNSTTGGWYPGNRKGNGESAVLILDNSSLTISGDYIYPGNSGDGAANAKCDLILTNNATLTVVGFHGRQGSVRQYEGTSVYISQNAGGVFRLASGGTSSFDYYLYGGTLTQSHSGNDATFSLGMSTSGSGTEGKGSLHIFEGGTFIAKGNDGYIGRYQKDKGFLDVCGGTAIMAKEGATLNVGYEGSGMCEVTDGGILDIQKGTIVAVPKRMTDKGRIGTVSVTSEGVIKARAIYSDTTNCTATLILDGGKVVANTGASEGFIHGFTAASVGLDGVKIDTNGQDLEIMQSFTAQTGEEAPTADTAVELAALPAFTKVGAGVLKLTGTNEWLCATCVSNGTLQVGERALPPTTLRLGGGVIDLDGNTHTVANLIGSGVVSNGTLVVTGAVWPGVGDSGTLKIDATAELSFAKLGCYVASDGSCGRLEANGSLDLTGVTIVGEGIENKIQNRGLTFVKASALIGSPISDSSLLGNNVTVSDGRLCIGAPGLMLIVR